MSELIRNPATNVAHVQPQHQLPLQPLQQQSSKHSLSQQSSQYSSKRQRLSLSEQMLNGLKGNKSEEHFDEKLLKNSNFNKENVYFAGILNNRY